MPRPSARIAIAALPALLALATCGTESPGRSEGGAAAGAATGATVGILAGPPGVLLGALIGGGVGGGVGAMTSPNTVNLGDPVWSGK